eukprot:CAMPEP_0118636582 /NCGR_PEP_ID=MMETSP0785-20121206/2704_1 /TAXON_ID=91992 /ORGANISM="Bolidomonas pacifica, Strain CCMP 1866" /LENGTH=222 /DNA_ID=CAMNT_0006527727 /DNA_START=5 /DNA_END=673 /DNA_ORIENTATION=-
MISLRLKRLTLCVLAIFAFFAAATADASRCGTRNNIISNDRFHQATFDLFDWPFAAPHRALRPHHKRHHHTTTTDSSLYSYAVSSDDDKIKLHVTLPGFDSSSLKVTLSTKTEPTEKTPVSTLTIEPRNEKATGSFQATSFTLDPDIDLRSLSSTMSNGVLEIVAQKLKPEVKTTELDIAAPPMPEKVSIEGAGDGEEPRAADPPSPNDSPDVEVYTEPSEE